MVTLDQIDNTFAALADKIKDIPQWAGQSVLKEKFDNAAEGTLI
jgi:hypothetical protein